MAGGHASHTVNYAYYQAFNGMLDKIPLLEHIFTMASTGSTTKEVTKGALDLSVCACVRACVRV